MLSGTRQHVVNGEYTFQGSLKHKGRSIRKWDTGVYQDDDGAGYLITHSGKLYRLRDDYKSVDDVVVEGMTEGRESPAVFKRDGVYYWLGSGLTGWERNDNFYFTATDLRGQWKKHDHFAPEGTLTWNSQTRFVLPIVGSQTTTFIFMGDRWAHPHQNSAATYVWQPLQFDQQGRLSLPKFHQSWRVDLTTGAWSSSELEGDVIDIGQMKGATYSQDWSTYTDESGHSDVRSDTEGASLTIEFHSTRCGLYSVARPDGGFAEIQLEDAKGNVFLSTVMEIYCLYNESSLKFLSPKLERGDYVLRVTVLGEHFYWKGKKGTYGSQGDFVSVQKVCVAE